MLHIEARNLTKIEILPCGLIRIENHLTFGFVLLVVPLVSVLSIVRQNLLCAYIQVEFAGRVVTEEQKIELTRAVTGVKKARFQ